MHVETVRMSYVGWDWANGVHVTSYRGTVFSCLEYPKDCLKDCLND